MKHETTPERERDYTTYANDLGLPPDTGTAPLPVTVVGEVRTSEFPARVLVTGQTATLVDTVPAKVADANRQRLSLTIVNRSAGPVFVQGSSGITEGSAFELDAGQGLDLQASGEVWVLPSAEAAGGRVDWLAQFKDG